jgi:two-component system, chemotaxis family, chemotaxis protein CheY
MDSAANDIARKLVAMKVLVVDDEHTMRKVTRSLLQAVGIRIIHEANDGLSGLEAIRNLLPDVVIVDWEMPSPNGPEFVRTVRSPESFPLPNIPIIMLTGHGERSRVVEAIGLGVNEFLLKPVSTKTLLSRLISIVAQPRPMFKLGNSYVPEPRPLPNDKAISNPAWF